MGGKLGCIWILACRNSSMLISRQVSAERMRMGLCLFGYLYHSTNRPIYQILMLVTDFWTAFYGSNQGFSIFRTLLKLVNLLCVSAEWAVADGTCGIGINVDIDLWYKYSSSKHQHDIINQRLIRFREKVHFPRH